MILAFRQLQKVPTMPITHRQALAIRTLGPYLRYNNLLMARPLTTNTHMPTTTVMGTLIILTMTMVIGEGGAAAEDLQVVL